MERLDAQLMNSRKRKNESEIDLLGRNSSIGIGGSGSYLATLRAVSNFQSPDQLQLQPHPSFNAFWINNQQQHQPSAFLYPPQRPYIYPPGSSCNPFEKIFMPAALPTPPTPLGWQTSSNSYTHLTQLQHMTSAVVDPPPPPHPWLAPPTPEKKTCCSVENRRSFKSTEHSNYHHHAFNLNQQPVFQDDFVFCTQSQTNAQKYVSFGSPLADFHPPIQGDQGLLVEADYLSLGFESQRGNRSRDIAFGSGISFEEEFGRNNAGDVDLARVVSQELQRDSGSQLQSLASNDKVVHLEAVENLESHERDKSTEQKAKRRKHRPKVIIENSSSKSTPGRKGQKPKNNATENTNSLCPQELGKDCSRKCGTVTEETQNDQGSLPQGKNMQETIGENSHAENTRMNQGRMPEGKNIEEPVGENLHMEKAHMNQGSLPQGKNIDEPVGENFHMEKMHMNQGSMPQGKNIDEPVGENFDMEKKNMNQGSMPQGKNIEEPVGENFDMEKTHMNQGSMSHGTNIEEPVGENIHTKKWKQIKSHGKNIEKPVGENIHTKKWKQIKSHYGPSPAESALLKAKTSSKGKRQKTTLIPEEKKHQSGARKVRINGHSREVGLSNSLSHDGDIYGYLIQMMERLQLEERMDQLVPFVANKEMVTYEGPFHPLKKRKQRARVDLDGETHRMWRLLMGKAVSSDYLITDKDDKEMKWEEERKVFKGRADSFIARMHLVQGDRRYSHWKGSVVDSVIGAFLTQNVSDHLSSSAFMALVSRFPPVEEDKDDSHDDTEHISCSETGDLEVLMDLNKPLDYPCVEAPDSTLDFPELSNFLDIKGNEENTQDPCKQIAYNGSDCLKVGTCLTESMEFTSEVAPTSTQKYQYQFIEKCKDTSDHNAEHLACNGSDSSETVTDLNASTTCIRPLNSSQICRDVPQCLLVRENDQDDPKCIGCNTGDASKILSNLGKPVESKCAVLPISSQKLTSKALEKTSNGLNKPGDIMSLGVHNSRQYFTGALQCPLVKENEGNSQNDSEHIACNVNEASHMDTNLSKPVEPTSIVLPPSNRQFTSKSHEEIESSYHYNAEHFTCHGSYDSDPIADLNELWNITCMGAPKSVQHAIGASQFKEDRDNSQDETSHISCNRCYASETGTNLSKHIESTCVVLPKSTPQFPGNTKDHSGTLTGNGTIGNGHEDSSNTESDCVNSLEDKEDFSTSGDPKCQTILFGKNLCAAAERGEVYAPEIKKHQSCFSSPEILRSQKGVHEIKSQNTNQHTGELEDVISAKINHNKYFTTLLNRVVEGGNKKSSANFVSCSDSLLVENNIRATTLINAAEEIEISSITEEDMVSSFKGSVHGKDFRKHSIGIRENEYVAASFGPLPEKNTLICQESLDTPDAIRCLEHSEQCKPYDVSKGNKNSLRFAKLCARNMQLNSSDSVEGDERQLVSSSQNSVKANEISFLDEVTCKEQIEVQKSKSYKEPTHKISGIERANIEMKQGGNKKTADCETIKKKVYRYQFADKKLKKERHPDSKDAANWEAVRCANIEDIADVIKDRGMNNVLAGRIKAFLDRIHSEQGTLDLEWLKDVEGDDAKNFLLSIRGLGLKSVECIRLLSLQQKAFPVDTNVGRICVRLGWVPIQPLPESLQLHLLELYPVLETIQKYLWPRLCNLDQRTLYELHYQMITFGKVFCTKSRPNCNACPMRCDCKHFASAFASARLALPSSTDKSPLVPSELLLPSSKDKGDSSMICLTSQNFNQNVNSDINTKTLSIPLLETKVAQQNCEPIIEEPLSPEPECIEDSESVIDECSSVDPDEIPVINLNFEQLSENVQKIYESKVQSLTAFNSGELSKALVIVSPEAASIPQPKLKNIGRLRTEHRVYELPADHPVLIGFDKADDNHIPYLLAIWGPGESHDCNESFGKFSSFNSKDKDTCNEGSCGTCITEKNVMEDTVKGTILIPCKTATRGSFPLNGTYFQVNEVFADHETSLNPVEVPRSSIWNLARRVVYFGTSVPTIFRGLTAQEIQISFWKGSVCVRGFDRKSRAPRPLAARLHLSASKISRPNKQDKAKNDSANLRK